MKLHTRYYTDPKVVALPDADTEMLFIRGVAYAGDQETGGFIPDALVPLLARRRRYAECVDALVASGLWTRASGGYRMPAWSSWQDQLDVLAARRAADRERKRRKRAEEKPRTSTVRGQSADVRGLEGETELEPDLQGDSRTHDPPSMPCPPRTCQQHRDNPNPPPCGRCADARHAHDAWQTAHSNGTKQDPYAGQAAAATARAEIGTAHMHALAAEPPDPDAAKRAAEFAARLRGVPVHEGGT